ncbi:nucleic acid-binding, OB-fold protein [Tanacetum coccineum]|uniref:Nucleic acid-binding, OB-fold protein n=1 Tax=Tanacetum coccineum TaxID=301880 RepID=A0ABQ5D848_9ASTR
MGENIMKSIKEGPLSDGNGSQMLLLEEPMVQYQQGSKLRTNAKEQAMVSRREVVVQDVREDTLRLIKEDLFQRNNCHRQSVYRNVGAPEQRRQYYSCQAETHHATTVGLRYIARDIVKTSDSRLHTTSSDKMLQIMQAQESDYTGCLTRVTDVREFGGANKNLKVLRKLDIENLNGNVVELMLWDDMARNFKKTEYDSMEKLAIIAASSYKVSLYGAILQLILPLLWHRITIERPDIPHLNEYKAQQEVNPPLVISKERCHDLSHEKIRNRFALSTLMQQNPDTYRYIFKAVISDGTTTAQFTFFTPNADIVTHADCTQLVNLYDTPSPREFPSEIFNLQGQRHIFQFHYNPSREKGKIDFYFEDILGKPLQVTSETAPQTEAPEGGKLSVSGPKTPHLLSKETRHGETSTSPDTPSQLTTSDVIIKTPPTTETRFLLKEISDISTQETGSESPREKTHDEGASEEIPSKTTSKRPLF